MRNLIVSVTTSALIVSSLFSAECTNVDTLFPMEEISGSIGNTLEVVNGRVNSAIKFDGKSYINKGDIEDVGTGNFTIVSFVRTNAKRLSQSIIDKRENGKGYHLFLNSPGTSSSTLAFELNGVNFGSPNTTQINDNQWHCVAVSVDRNSATGGKLYIDPQNGVGSNNYHEFNPTVVSGDSTNSANLLIGGTQPNYSFSSNFDGIIDEVIFHSEALDEGNISCLCSNEARVEENDLPLIPLENSTFTINHDFKQEQPYLEPKLELSATNGIYENIPKNTLIPLTITSINVKDTNLSANSDSVYFKQDGDFIYVGFTKSGEFNVKVEGFDLSSNIMSNDKNFTTLANSAPIGNDAEFNIKSNEVLKFDANTYFSDVDSDILSFSNTEASKGKVQINDNVISYYPEQGSYSTSFTITATDTDGESVTSTFSVNVEFISDIEIAYGWNLLGNSLTDKDISTSAIVEGEEVIYRFSDNGFWEMSNLSYNEQYIKPTEGFWIKANSDRYLSISGVDAFQANTNPKQLIDGWNLLAETEEKPLRTIKAGFEQVFVYDKKNNTWLNSTTNPNFILPMFQGYWGKKADSIVDNGNGGSVGDTDTNESNDTQNQAPDLTQLNVSIISQNSGVNVNGSIENIITLDFETSENVTFTFSDLALTDSDSVVLSIDNSIDNLTFDKSIANIAENDPITLTTPSIDGNYSFKVVVTDSNNVSSYKDIQFNIYSVDDINTTDGKLVKPLFAPNSEIIGDYIYIFGAYYDNIIYRAPVTNPTQWEDTGAILPSTVTIAETQIIGDYVYLFDLNKVYRASLSDPTQWEDMGAVIPEKLRNSTSQIIGDYVYLFGGGSSLDSNKVFRAPLSDPTNWENTNSTIAPGQLHGGTSEVIGDYVYYFGGDSRNTIVRAPVSNPIPTEWENTGSYLPTAIGGRPISHIIGNYVYIFGGIVGLTRLDTIYRAPITNPSQFVDSGMTLPSALSFSTSKIIGDYVYFFGGGDASGITDMIYKIPLSSLQ